MSDRYDEAHDQYSLLKKKIERQIAGFQAALEKMRNDPAEAARIDALIDKLYAEEVFNGIELAIPAEGLDLAHVEDEFSCTGEAVGSSPPLEITSHGDNAHLNFYISDCGNHGDLSSRNIVIRGDNVHVNFYIGSDWARHERAETNDIEDAPPSEDAPAHATPVNRQQSAMKRKRSRIRIRGRAGWWSSSVSSLAAVLLSVFAFATGFIGEPSIAGDSRVSLLLILLGIFGVVFFLIEHLCSLLVSFRLSRDFNGEDVNHLLRLLLKHDSTERSP